MQMRPDLRALGASLAAMRTLDGRLWKCALLAGSSNFDRKDPRPVSPELFLCALYLRHRRRVTKFFRDGAAFGGMVDKLWAKDARGKPLVPRWKDVSRNCPSETMTVFSAFFDGELRDLLMRAAAISQAAMRRKTRIPDVMSALAIDGELAGRLDKEYGLRLKSIAGAPWGRGTEPSDRL
jgi:hypothetical protein